MDTFVLDTNVVCALRRPEKADPNLMAWAADTPIANFFLSSITVLELELGILLMERKDPEQGAVLGGHRGFPGLHGVYGFVCNGFEHTQRAAGLPTVPPGYGPGGPLSV